MSTKLMNYINGEWVVPEATTYMDVINPATTEVIGQVPDSTGNDVDRAVQAAKTVHQSRRKKPSPQKNN